MARRRDFDPLRDEFKIGLNEIATYFKLKLKLKITDIDVLH